MFSFLIITRIFYGRFLFLLNLKSIIFLFVSELIFELNLREKLKLSNVITAVNLKMIPLSNFVKNMECILDSHVHTPLLKMANRNEKLKRLTMLFVRSFVMLLCLLLFGIMHLKWLHTFTISCPQKYLVINHLLKSYIQKLRIIHIYVSLGVYVIL